MAWDHLSINKPHVVYIILGGFTSLFMLCSSIIKERLYIGEATVATICGVIFGPYAADLINPATWGNVDQITLEFSRIVLVVQCFAVGVELPRAYMEKHWKSVVFLLVPVMTFGWLVTSLFIWAVFYTHMNWLDCLVCAACVTATDPVLASSVVGKGKFAKRVPKHLRDLLSAESGCNDGMAFPFIYLGIYLVRYRPDANEVSLHWFVFTILYECIFGAFYGVVVGYAARRAIRYAHEYDLIDRESFLVFYFVLALFCAGSGSLLGMDDLLVGFACGVGFSNDGWFLEKTEEAHVSNVIDLLINLAFFVYFGTIIPWNLYASEHIGTSPWRLVVIAVLVIFFRRIPIMLALKPVIPDIKTWREALFAGHFGPIGVGALFVAILARAEFETDTTTPLAKLPEEGFEHRNIIELIWPITTFLVITSIIIHGSSVAVFTLGRHINTLTFTMSYTRAKDDESNWMDRLPRISSRSKSSMSLQKGIDSDQEDIEEKFPDYPPSVYSAQGSNPLNIPRNFLKRLKEDDSSSRASSRRPLSRKSKNIESGLGPGGPVEASAIGRQSIGPPESPATPSPEKIDSDSTAVSSEDSPTAEESEEKISKSENHHEEHPTEVFEEGDRDVIEDETGRVLAVKDSSEHHPQTDQRSPDQSATPMADAEGDQDISTKLEPEISPLNVREEGSALPNNSAGETGGTGMMRKISAWGESLKAARAAHQQQQQQQQQQRRPSQNNGRNHLPAHAFRFGNTVIVEDEDGEVIRKFNLPPRTDRPSYSERMGLQKWIGRAQQEVEAEASGSEDPSGRRKSAAQGADDDEENTDEQLRFTMRGTSRRLSTVEFIQQIQNMDPRVRPQAINEEQEEPEEANKTGESGQRPRQPATRTGETADRVTTNSRGEVPQNLESVKVSAPTSEDLTRLDSAVDQEIPVHSVSEDLRKNSVLHGQRGETGADRRRRLVSQARPIAEQEGPHRQASPQGAMTAKGKARTRDDTEETPAERRRRLGALGTSKEDKAPATDDTKETPAERRRRLGALGTSKEDSDNEDESAPRQPPKGAVKGDPGQTASASTQPTPPSRFTGIRFADQPSSAGGQSPSFSKVTWASDKTK